MPGTEYREHSDISSCVKWNVSRIYVFQYSGRSTDFEKEVDDWVLISGAGEIGEALLLGQVCCACE